ncbi:hypothetical protein F5Y05DRAFT_407803 [Hypoxylon sp. FL0543]|nr:hypothetical protein F5Y05DRAFT_407803 [Hypoxylon sp. FL0543]
MPSAISSAIATLLFASRIGAHFTVQYPASVGPFIDDQEPNPPCGGYSPSIDDVQITDFHVDGDAIATTLTHLQGTWMYRATTDPNAKGNWTEISPIFQQSGSGAFCNAHVTVPHEFIGKKGYIGMISHAVDGFLWQCSGVNFVAGTGSQPDVCKNASGVSASFTDDGALAGQLNNSGQATSPERTANLGVSGKAESFQTLGGMVAVGMAATLATMFLI